MTLTERQTAVAKLLAIGMSNKMIGDKLGLSLGTVKCHVSEILNRLGVSNRTQAALKLREGSHA